MNHAHPPLYPPFTLSFTFFVTSCRSHCHIIKPVINSQRWTIVWMLEQIDCFLEEESAGRLTDTSGCKEVTAMLWVVGIFFPSSLSMQECLQVMALGVQNRCSSSRLGIPTPPSKDSEWTRIYIDYQSVDALSGVPMEIGCFECLYYTL